MKESTRNYILAGLAVSGILGVVAYLLWTRKSPVNGVHLKIIDTGIGWMDMQVFCNGLIDHEQMSVGQTVEKDIDRPAPGLLWVTILNGNGVTWNVDLGQVTATTTHITITAGPTSTTAVIA